MTALAAPDGFGSLDCLNRRREAVAMIAVDYRSELQAAINLMPHDTARFHLEGLLYAVDRTIEAEVAFRAACEVKP